MEWLSLILTYAEPLLIGAIGAAVGWLGMKLGAKKSAIQAIEASVTKTYLEYVEPIKKKRKLNPEEKRQARERTWANIMSLAKGPALKLVTSWGKDYVQHLVEKIINKLKK